MLFSKTAKKLVWTQNKNWLNSKPISCEELKGKLVLLDFWTYSCINCLRTLPALTEMWQKYKDKKFVIIGVHTPEFEFEKDLMNVQKAVRKLGIEYPILNDPERINWENHGNTYWPRAALINKDGEIILDHVGESGYDEIDAEIIAELKKMKQITTATKYKEQQRFYHPSVSPETYAGSARNAGLGSAKVCTKSGCDEYYDSGKYHPNIIYLQGDWLQTNEYLEFKGEQGHFAFKYFAKEVNVVMEGSSSAAIMLDNKPLPVAAAGKDVQVKYDKALVFLHGADMYNVINNKDYHEGVLKIIPSKGLRVYALTFG
ncbi:MAG TPA: thioredoxin-like domain-containing protein [Candidatus Nanoarchaeia archaeon]|nr:thioredoxin-like domain-containing protein [Candidatus Nanoarchaeia archaeon]